MRALHPHVSSAGVFARATGDKGWDVYNDHLVKAVEPLTPERLELKISPNLRSIGQLARHIIRTRAGWLYGLMGEGGPHMATIAEWEYEGDVPATAELVRYLEVTFRAWQECLQRWTPEDMEYIFRGERGASHTSCRASG